MRSDQKCDDNKRSQIRGLYVITPELDDTIALLLKVKAALEGGAAVVQYRNKKSSSPKRIEHAIALAALCEKHGATFIVNDDVKLAFEVDADGVHLGKADGDITAARKKLGANKRIGASCYDRPELAEAAVGAGADHIAFGAVFASTTKPNAVRASLDLFNQARHLNVPMVAIGGITAENAAPVLTAGAHALAVISDVFDAADVKARARAYASLFPSHS